MSSDFDFAALANFLSDFLTRFVAMIYNTKTWFAKAAATLKHDTYDAEAEGENTDLLGHDVG